MLDPNDTIRVNMNFNENLPGFNNANNSDSN